MKSRLGLGTWASHKQLHLGLVVLFSVGLGFYFFVEESEVANLSGCREEVTSSVGYTEV